MDFKPLVVHISYSLSHLFISIWSLNWDQTPNHTTIQTIGHSATACLLLLSVHFLLVSRNKSQHKSGSLNNNYGASQNIPKHRKSPANVRTPSVISPEPLPKRPENPGPRPSSLVASTVAFAEISCSTTVASPFSAAQCSAVTPRRWGCEAVGCGCRRKT